MLIKQKTSFWRGTGVDWSGVSVRLPYLPVFRIVLVSTGLAHRPAFHVRWRPALEKHDFGS